MKIDEIKQDVITQKQKLIDAVEFALQQTNKGATSAEVSINQSTGIDVSARLGEVENVEYNHGGALSITVYHQQKKGTASTNNLSFDAIAQTVKSALDIMKYTSEDPLSGLADKSLMAFDTPDLDLFHPGDLDVDKAIQLAIETEQVALSQPQISGSDGGQYSSSYGTHVYGNTHGMLGSYSATRHSLSCSVIGEKNGHMERNYSYTIARDTQDLSSAQWVGLDAAKRTVEHLGAEQLATMEVPVLFNANVASGLLGHLVSAISGGSIYRKSSFLLDSLDKIIFPEWLTIQELPHLLKALGSSPFDGEGVRTSTRNIIENGALKTYLLSNYSAKKLGMQSTGHADGIHNWRVTSNGGGLTEMLRKLDKGVFITSLMGQGANTITGDYSRGAKGFWVENGQIQYPIHEITVAGNLKEMFKNIIAIGDDIEKRTNIQSGSILIDRMSIAGK